LVDIKVLIGLKNALLLLMESAVYNILWLTSEDGCNRKAQPIVEHVGFFESSVGRVRKLEMQLGPAATENQESCIQPETTGGKIISSAP